MNNDENDNICDDIVDDYNYLHQTFLNIGMEIAAMCNDPYAIMRKVLRDIIALHPCKDENDDTYDDDDWSDFLSISSEEFYDDTFKYYISSSDEEE